MAIGDIIELHIESIVAGGSGLGKEAGRTVFVDQTAPGDLIEARICEEKTGFARAELRKLLKASPDRVAAVCPLYGECGGCSLQHLSYEAQLKAKASIVAGAFSRLGGFSELGIPEIVASSPFEYRNRMQFHRVKKALFGVSKIGLKKRKSDDCIPVRHCPIADPGINEALQKDLLSMPLASDRFTVYSRGKTLLSEGGLERGTVGILGKELRLDVRGFFQSNAEVLEKLIPELLAVADTADPEGRAADLYCGVGTFASFLADRFSRVDLLERDKSALSLAQQNVRGKGIAYFALSDDQWSKLPYSKNEEGYTLAVVDPPRIGLSRAIRKKICEMKVGVLVYVSCDPASLARDAKELCEQAYTLESLKAFDFYPQSAHVEAMAVFRSRP
ncbi:RsmD family RNA methyltransferase [Treponema sp.]